MKTVYIALPANATALPGGPEALPPGKDREKSAEKTLSAPFRYMAV